MTNKNKLLFFLFLILTLVSCYEDDIIRDDIKLITKDHPAIIVSANIVGIVHDEFGNELSGFTEQLANNFYSSHQTGYYHFDAKNIDKNGTPILISKDNSKYQFTINPIENEVNYFSHTIFTKPKIENKLSNQLLELNLENNTIISINANSYKEGDIEFSGDVKIKTVVIDLQNPYHLEALPGNHLAMDIEGNDVWLEYFNAIYLDIKSSSDKQLNLKENEAFIRFNSSQSDCDECLVWRYDTEKFLWIEHKVPENINNIKFKITESGFYSFAKPNVYNLVAGQLLADEVPFRNQAVDIYNNERLLQRIYTTNTGRWFTHLPINSQYEYKFEISKNYRFSKEFQLGEEDRNKLSVYKTDKLSVINFKGEVRNCNDELVTNHFFQVWQDHKYKCIFLLDPQVDIDIVASADITVKLQSADESWNDIGPQQSFNKPKKEINFKKSYSCTQFKGDGYLNIKIDNEEKILNPPVATYLNGRTKFEIYDFNDTNLDTKIEVYITGQEARNYSDNELNIYIEHLEINGTEYELNCKTSTAGCGFESFEIEYFGENKGEWIKGSFKGEFWVKTNNPFTASYKTIEADFLVQRNF